MGASHPALAARRTTAGVEDANGCVRFRWEQRMERSWSSLLTMGAFGLYREGRYLKAAPPRLSEQKLASADSIGHCRQELGSGAAGNERFSHGDRLTLG